MGEHAENPAALHEYDPAWRSRAARHLASIQRALEGLPGAESAAYDHIGSTSVPGLTAKPFIDLQVRVLPLPSRAALATRLEPLGGGVRVERARSAPSVAVGLPGILGV